MPNLQKVFQLDISVEQFVNACSQTELQELDLLLSARLQNSTHDKAQKAFQPKFVGPATGHNGDLRRCAICGYYKQL